jgi:hypothetical protein
MQISDIVRSTLQTRSIGSQRSEEIPSVCFVHPPAWKAAGARAFGRAEDAEPTRARLASAAAWQGGSSPITVHLSRPYRPGQASPGVAVPKLDRVALPGVRASLLLAPRPPPAGPAVCDPTGRRGRPAGSEERGQPAGEFPDWPGRQ